MERYRENMRDLHMVFIDLEKILQQAREVMWWTLEKKHILCVYIEVSKDMYSDTVKIGVNISAFPITVVLQQGSFKFLPICLVMDQLTRHVQDEVPCILFAQNIVLVGETRKGFVQSQKLEALESLGFTIIGLKLNI